MCFINSLCFLNNERKQLNILKTKPILVNLLPQWRVSFHSLFHYSSLSDHWSEANIVLCWRFENNVWLLCILTAIALCIVKVAIGCPFKCRDSFGCQFKNFSKKPYQLYTNIMCDCMAVLFAILYHGAKRCKTCLSEWNQLLWDFAIDMERTAILMHFLCKFFFSLGCHF